MDYGARFYSSTLGRFISPDTIIPVAAQGNGAFDRYAYVNNNPVRYTDPTGHYQSDGGSGRFGTTRKEPSITNKINALLRPDLIIKNGSYANWGQFRGKDEIAGNCNKGLRWHMSVDGFSSQYRPFVYAGMGGTVVYSGYDAGFGNTVIVETEVDGQLFYSVYAHLGYDTNPTDPKVNGRLVKKGDIVKAGDKIGTMGNSGHQDYTDKDGNYHENVHLHFEVRTSANINDDMGPSNQRYWGFSQAWTNDFVDISPSFGLSQNATEYPIIPHYYMNSANSSTGYCPTTMYGFFFWESLFK